MECTGERYMPEFDGDWTLEHTHRYMLACELAGGKTVLDIACGDGYGSRMLADTAAQVFGVDISLETITRACAKYSHSRLSFLQGSATAIPLADDSVDLVTSFETIEHLAEQELMLQEIRRVLRPEGILVISSPDKREYSDITGYINAYHVKELYRNEFEQLLKMQFSHLRMLGQRIAFGSVIGAEDDTGFVSWRKGQQARTTGLVDAEYLIALAGNALLPLLPSSLMKGLVEQSNPMRDLGTQLGEMNSYLELSLDRLNWLEKWEKEARAYIADLEFRLTTETEKLTRIQSSRSWRMTAPLRRLAAFMRKLLHRQKQPVNTQPSSVQILSQPVKDWPPDVRALEKSIVLKSVTESSFSVGVFLHIFYENLTWEILSCIDNLPDSATIHISTDTDAKRKSIATLCAQKNLAERTEIRVCPNKGWDIAPFFVGFADRIPGYPLILRLHTKQSSFLTSGVGAAWRNMLFNSLAGSPERVNAIMQAFADSPSLGLICPPVAAHYANSMNCGKNQPLMQQLLRQHDIALHPTTPIDFPMGSMFWCRPEVLSPWLDQHFSFDDFTATDKNERDGTLAHALERLLFFGCGITGYSWARLSPPPAE